MLPNVPSNEFSDKTIKDQKVNLLVNYDFTYKKDNRLGESLIYAILFIIGENYTFSLSLKFFFIAN